MALVVGVDAFVGLRPQKLAGIVSPSHQGLRCGGIIPIHTHADVNPAGLPERERSGIRRDAAHLAVDEMAEADDGFCRCHRKALKRSVDESVRDRFPVNAGNVSEVNASRTGRGDGGEILKLLPPDGVFGRCADLAQASKQNIGFRRIAAMTETDEGTAFGGRQVESGLKRVGRLVA